MKNRPRRTEIITRDEKKLYVVYYKDQQFYTSKPKLSDHQRLALGYALRKPIYYSIKQAQEAIINFITDYSLDKKDFSIVEFMPIQHEYQLTKLGNERSF